MREYYKSFKWDEDYDDMVDVICPLVARGDKTEIAQFLHDIEEQSVKKEKLDHLWERTPFPIEAEL